jgi:hypothetical protein
MFILTENLLLLGVEVKLIETLRHPDRQQYYLTIGSSWTKNSKHLAQPPYGLALAFDIVPISVLRLRNWAPEHPVWNVLGDRGREVGLSWGGDYWLNKDKPHFYLPKCVCQNVT